LGLFERRQQCSLEETENGFEQGILVVHTEAEEHIVVEVHTVAVRIEAVGVEHNRLEGEGHMPVGEVVRCMQASREPIQQCRQGEVGLWGTLWGK
jgi:hypothetical protein